MNKRKQITKESVIEAIENIAEDNDIQFGSFDRIIVPFHLSDYVACDSRYIENIKPDRFVHGWLNTKRSIPIVFSDSAHAIEFDSNPTKNDKIIVEMTMDMRKDLAELEHEYHERKNKIIVEYAERKARMFSDWKRYDANNS